PLLHHLSIAPRTRSLRHPPPTTLTPLLFFSCSRDPPAPPSFPTRRSSDLTADRIEWFSSIPLSAAIMLVRNRARRNWAISACAVDRKSTRLNSSHEWNSYAVFCLKKKNTHETVIRPADGPKADPQQRLHQR